MVSSWTVEVCDKNVSRPKLIKVLLSTWSGTVNTYIMRSLKINGIYQAVLCHDVDGNGNAQSYTSYLITRRGDNKLCIIAMLHHFENRKCYIPLKYKFFLCVCEVRSWFDVLNNSSQDKRNTFISLWERSHCY